jgi:hypothetical protein
MSKAVNDDKKILSDGHRKADGYNYEYNYRDIGR